MPPLCGWSLADFALPFLLKTKSAAPEWLASIDLGASAAVPGRTGFTYTDIGIYISPNGKGGYHIRCVQCGGGAAAAGHLELFGAAGAGGGGHRGEPAHRATFGVEASAGAARCWSGARAAQRTPHVLSNQRGGD